MTHDTRDAKEDHDETGHTHRRRVGVASDLWVQAALDQRQRFQQLFFPDGMAFDGNRFIGTGATAPAFSYLRGIQTGNEGLVDLNSGSWNRIAGWLRQLDLVRSAA